MASTQSMNGKMAAPIETKANIDKDYDYYIAKYNSQLPPAAPPPRNSKYQGNLGAVPMEPVSEQRSIGTPPRHPATSQTTPPESKDSQQSDSPANEEEQVDGDEALLDLAQLEELHHEAERMKALGNKHMAAQEYTRAYNAYSAALQLSPVGPSSHVFLSNRSAALLSLKRYSAAATDARRAIALAPTFGKAHARLGQSLYFLKDYEGAVSAYEDAIHYEPDNPITRTYLEKAKTKLQRQKEKAARASRGEEVSVLTAESSVQATVINSVATDPNASAAVVQTMGFRGQSNAMSNAVGGALAQTPRSIDDPIPEDDDDPDFDEALRIQERANRYLANKNYKYAIEEYTAALFLVPDDENLSPDLHLGRAHGLNGSRRHESAMIDAKLAIKIKPTPEGYSTLAKSLFYMKDYQGAVDAFAKCKEMLPEGESLSMFDRAYLQKSEAALQEALQSDRESSPSQIPRSGSSAPIPKLKPPRFVPREEALNRTPNMPSMPKAWPQQSPRASQVLQCGPEREILFLSEALGIKLNRGPDGVVRVIDVSPEVPGSPIARKGRIAIGDVVREAAGVDIRRPITNIMWGDTVALIKMAPRPIVLIVAEELNASGIVHQRKNAAANALSPTSASHFFPSNSSGEESVKDQMKKSHLMDVETSGIGESDGDEAPILPDTDQSASTEAPPASGSEVPVDVKSSGTGKSDGDEAAILSATEQLESNEAPPASDNEVGDNTIPAPQNQSLLDEAVREEQEMEGDAEGEIETLAREPDIASSSEEKTSEDAVVNKTDQIMDDPKRVSTTCNESEQDEDIPTSEETTQSAAVERSEETLRDKEFAIIGAEIYFKHDSSLNYGGWDNLRFMAYSGTRKVRLCEPVYRFFPGQRNLFWSGDQYLPRTLVIYDEPNVILILRAPEGLPEMREILGLPVGAQVEDPKSVAKSYLVVESVIDPSASKLRLSPLTTATSFFNGTKESDHRRQCCFEVVSPMESVVLSAVRMRVGAERSLTSFVDSGAFLETSTVEHALKAVICKANEPGPGLEDVSWMHQIILGTLHSFVLLGNQSDLDRSIAVAMRRSKSDPPSKGQYLDERVVDEPDPSGRTPLHYACSTRFVSAVASLVNAGANVDARIEPTKLTPCHICAVNLDRKSLSTILEKNRRPNVLDSLGRTPVSLAITEGRTLGDRRCAKLLDECLEVLLSYGADLGPMKGQRHPVSYLASLCLYEEVSVLFKHLNFRYPLLPVDDEGSSSIGVSVDAFFHYPSHSCLIAFRQIIQDHIKCLLANNGKSWADSVSAENDVLKTLEELFSRGFEPNERLEAVVDSFDGSSILLDYVGFAPIQILAAASLDAAAQKDKLGEEEYLSITGSISNICEFLVKHGARVSIQPPPDKRREALSDDARLKVEEAGTDAVDKSCRKIPPSHEFYDLLGSHRLKSAEVAWKSMKPVESTGKYILHTDKEVIEDSHAPGGTDEKSCYICWKVFGTLMNRKHRCRIGRRYVCDECSTKRIVDNGEEHRVSDGQYLLARADASSPPKSNAKQQAENKTNVPDVAARLERLEAEEAANRTSLFGSAMESVGRAVFGEGDESQNATSSRIEGLSANLGQTRDALNQRGEKLNTLADKSDKLVEASKDFASMAAELNKQSQGGLFW